MYDLGTRPEQADQPSADPGMERRRGVEAPGPVQPGLGRTGELGAEDPGDKASPDTTTTALATPTSMLGKRHHSLYENLNGFEVEGLCKVGLEGMLLSTCNPYSYTGDT